MDWRAPVVPEPPKAAEPPKGDPQLEAMWNWARDLAEPPKVAEPYVYGAKQPAYWKPHPAQERFLAQEPAPQIDLEQFQPDDAELGYLDDDRADYFDDDDDLKEDYDEDE